MKRKKVKIKRIDASTLRPEKLKPFNSDEFIKLSKELQEAVKKEEKDYGGLERFTEQL